MSTQLSAPAVVHGSPFRGFEQASLLIRALWGDSCAEEPLSSRAGVAQVLQPEALAYGRYYHAHILLPCSASNALEPVNHTELRMLVRLSWLQLHTHVQRTLHGLRGFGVGDEDLIQL